MAFVSAAPLRRHEVAADFPAFRRDRDARSAAGPELSPPVSAGSPDAPMPPAAGDVRRPSLAVYPVPPPQTVWPRVFPQL